MYKLLSANLFRLNLSRMFRIELAAVFLLGVVEAAVAVIQHRIHLTYGLETHLDDIFFGYSLFIGIFMSIFCSLFLGTEYSDGTLRSKIISGHLRKNIYLSNLITCIAAALTLCAVYLITVSVIGVPFMGGLTQEPEVILLKLFGTISLAISFCSIFTLLSMLLQDKTIVVILELLFVAVFSVIAFMLNDYTEWMNEAAGVKYYVFTLIHSFLPMGQSIRFSDVDYTVLTSAHAMRMIGSSLLVSVISTVIGCKEFADKDIK